MNLEDKLAYHLSRRNFRRVGLIALVLAGYYRYLVLKDWFFAFSGIPAGHSYIANSAGRFRVERLPAGNFRAMSMDIIGLEEYGVTEDNAVKRAGELQAAVTRAKASGMLH